MLLVRRKLRYVEKKSYAISPIELKSKCFRRWAFQRIGRLSKVETTAKEFGKNAHAMAEAYLRDGTIPDMTKPEGKVFAKGVHLLPPPGQVLTEETHFFTVDGITFDITIDFRGRGWSFIGDHKFVSDTRHTDWYPIEPEALAENAQSNLYALGGCIKGRKSAMPLFWAWYPKKRGEALGTSIVLPAERSLRYVRSNLIPHVWDMQAAIEYFRKVPETSRLRVINQGIPCNESACDLYNELCPYSQHCTR